MWEVSFRRYKAAALQVKHNIDKYMSTMHVRIPNSSLRVLVSLLATAAMWSFIPLATSQVPPPPSPSPPASLLPPPFRVSWLTGPLPAPVLRGTQSAASGQGCSALSWRDFLRCNSLDDFSRGDRTLLCRLCNSWCLDSLSVVFLCPTKTDLFRLTRWCAAAEARVTAERWNRFDFFFLPYRRKLPTAEQLLCF